MTTYKTYSAFNSVSVQGRIFNAEVVSTPTSEFLAVTVITNLKDGDEGVTVTFNTTGGLKTLFEGGYLPNGRMITVTGHINEISETYTTKEGELKLRQRPQLHLVQVNTHVGPMPADKTAGVSRKGQTVLRPSDATKVSKVTAVEVDDEVLASLRVTTLLA